MQVCSVCGVTKENGVFQTSRDRANSTISDKDFVYTRICRYARKTGCINTDGLPDGSKCYSSTGVTTEMWLEDAKDLIEKYS